jgi:hypothetical protein
MACIMVPGFAPAGFSLPRRHAVHAWGTNVAMRGAGVKAADAAAWSLPSYRSEKPFEKAGLAELAEYS